VGGRAWAHTRSRGEVSPAQVRQQLPGPAVRTLRYRKSNCGRTRALQRHDSREQTCRAEIPGIARRVDQGKGAEDCLFRSRRACERGAESRFHGEVESRVAFTSRSTASPAPL